MKKTVLFTIGIISVGFTSMKAQTTLTKVLPPIGSKMIMKNVTSTLLPANMGADQAWDYSSATFKDVISYEITEFNILNQTIQNTFPTTTYVQTMLIPGSPDKNLNAMTFMESRPDLLYILGAQASGGKIEENASDTLFLFNHPFNTTLSYGSKFVKYVGYGSMNIDGKLFENVIMHEYTNKISGSTQHYFFTLSPYFQLLLVCAIKNNAVTQAYYYRPVPSTTGLEKGFSKESAMNAYPNPTTDKLFINSNSDYTIFNSIGTEVEKGTISGNSIDVSQLDNGVYHLQLSGSGNNQRLKFIKQ